MKKTVTPYPICGKPYELTEWEQPSGERIRFLSLTVDGKVVASAGPSVVGFVPPYVIDPEEATELLRWRAENWGSKK